jgi:hypothetical protein
MTGTDADQSKKRPRQENNQRMPLFVDDANVMRLPTRGRNDLPRDVPLLSGEAVLSLHQQQEEPGYSAFRYAHAVEQIERIAALGRTGTSPEPRRTFTFPEEV